MNEHPLLKSAYRRARHSVDWCLNNNLHATYRSFSARTMIPRQRYTSNLSLAARVASIPGAVVECGVWRGGMIAGIAQVLGPARQYVLFDSFEGLPDAKPVDGPAALRWQSDTTSPNFHDNCKANLTDAIDSMALAGINHPDIRAGWFDSTVPAYAAAAPSIALLRLDGDWYDSTITCLTNLFPLIAARGMLIIDDYGTWDGCTRALHRYLADNDRPEAIQRTTAGVAYLVKT